MQRALISCGVKIDEVDAVFVGAGADANLAWEAFKRVAALPAYDPFVDAYGDTCHVSRADGGDLLLFEASHTSRLPDRGWRSLEDVGEPRRLALAFTRQFSFSDARGEYLGMNGLTLTFEVVIQDKSPSGLADVQLWGRGGPPSSDGASVPGGGEEGPLPDVAAWSQQVEESAQFRRALIWTPERFFFQQDDY